MAIFVMLNNFFHDFAVALLFACLLVLTFLYRRVRHDSKLRGEEFVRQVYRWLRNVVIGSWVMIIVGGIVRTLAYEQYEWMEAAGRGQVAALVIKHILLVSFVAGGTVLQWRLKRIFAESHAQS